MHMKKSVKLLKNCIYRIRESWPGDVHCETLTEEQMHYVREGYRLGLMSAAMSVADELAAEDPDGDMEKDYGETEHNWWLDNTE